MSAFLLAAALLAAAPTTQTGATQSTARAELSDAEIAASVESYLGSIDTLITADRWRALGPRAAPVLEELAQNPERLPTRRARAVEALSFIGSQNAESIMLRFAKSEAEPPVVRMSAMRGAGRLMGPAKLVAALKPILTDSKDTHIRAAAAEVLAHRSPSAGCAAVQEQTARELGDKRIAFQRAVDHCNATLEK